MTLEAALDYAASGLRIFPVGPDKRPLVREWPTVATTDHDQIVKWWDATFPDAGIGLATGDRLAESRYLFVVDLDRHDPAADGIEAWMDLVDANDRDVIEGPRALTPSGGEHLYFTSPYPLTNARGTLPNGIDVRGRGGYVVLPGSTTSGGTYEWDSYSELGEVKIPEAPKWLLAVLDTKADPKPSPKPSSTTPDVWAALDDRPGTIWHHETEWKTLLEADGWTYLRAMADGTQEWARPGQPEQGKTGATVNYGGADRLVVHSTNANVPADSYSKLGYYAAAHHGGDFSAATKAIIAEQDPKPSSAGTSPNDPNPSSDGRNSDENDWNPVDVVDIGRRIAAGQYQAEEPLFLKVEGTLALLYAGRSHVIFGPPGGGKTWIALAAIAERLIAGDHVLMIDFEDSAAGTVERLLRLGVTVDDLGRFDYRSVASSLAFGWKTLVESTTRYSLIVIDSTGEALAAQGVNPNDDGEVAVWMSLVKLLTLREGSPAVLLLDHVPKSTENPHGAPIGSQRKLAAITGAAYRCDTKTEPAKGTPGVLKLTTAKDRLGHRAKNRVAAVVEIEDVMGDDWEIVGIEVRFRVEQHDDRNDGDTITHEQEIMLRVSEYLEGGPGDVSPNAVIAGVKGSAVSIRAALDSLVSLGYVRRTPADGRRGDVLNGLRPYDPNDLEPPERESLSSLSSLSNERKDSLAKAGRESFQSFPPLIGGERKDTPEAETVGNVEITESDEKDSRPCPL